ncbi:MAG: hypothetical protein KME43_08110 [Myxacorys chilensis ATA2-1-KO14]|jgi:hypothetical protein|nr:hypothetical protein [Myxacorys chilensis ATA2-1-KO14]
MLSFKKKIVTDETMQPIAVLINYQDWQQIEKILEDYQLEDETPDDISEFEGILQLTEDPLKYQRRIRNEWE